jgi:hypothetical protein
MTAFFTVEAPCSLLQGASNAHPPQAGCAYESVCALPSGVIRGFETASNDEIPFILPSAFAF